MFDRKFVREKGESFVDLTLDQAIELQDLRFCRVTPTTTPGRWRITDVAKVGVAVVAGCELHVIPKTPLENIVFMASLGGLQLQLTKGETSYGVDASIPAAIARAFVVATDEATRRGLLKGYRSVQDSTSVVRGRWDIPRQLGKRPGIPLPVEVDFDDFTEDIDENRILRTALDVLSRIDGVAVALGHTLKGMQVRFADVESLPRGLPLPEIRPDRLNQRYAVPMRLARVILEAVSWTHREGAAVGGTFLVNMATVFEAYITNRLRSNLADSQLDVIPQDRRWWLDVDRSIALRPDIVISHGGAAVAVADTKYKVLGDSQRAAPNGDVYQAIAYALALKVPTAHLLYVSGDVLSQVLHLPDIGLSVHLHAIPLAGTVEDLEAGVTELALALRAQLTSA